MPSEFASETALVQSDVRALRGALMLACEDADQSSKSSTDTWPPTNPRTPLKGIWRNKCSRAPGASAASK